MKTRRTQTSIGLFLPFALFVPFALFAGLLGLVGCGGPDPEAENVLGPPLDVNSFRPVSAVLERRCGTLDCHGQPARPLRIFGQYGLRRYEPEGSPNVENYAEYYSGGKEPTTLAELQDNYRALLGLEPEITAKVYAKVTGPESLTLVRKARLQEKHKGGLLWNKGDPGDVCLTNWLTGNTDTTQCEVELGHP